jgi:pSer/pThr/pTyr-binding forkhead associated (FHA) protein
LAFRAAELSGARAASNGVGIHSDPGPLLLSAGTVLTDPQVSRVHCEIAWAGDRVLVTDRGGAAGTWVNGKKLTEPHELLAGDMLAVGDTHLEFKWSREDEQVTSSWGGRGRGRWSLVFPRRLALTLTPPGPRGARPAPPAIRRQADAPVVR